jgi:RNA polymerase sigma-70 factor (ECF subfamily)
MNQSQSSPMPTDAEIIARVLGGDLHAYGALVDRYERAVLAAALSVLRDRHAAEDVTQDVLTQGYLQLASLRDGSRFGFWLLRIARREAWRSRRKRVQSKEAIDASIENSSGVNRNGPLLDDAKEQLLADVQCLPEHERLMISLRYFADHSVQEIATITGRPVGTVTKQLSRAIERLRARMGTSELRVTEVQI